MSEFVGGPVSKEVVDQIKVREDILSKKTPENYLRFVSGNNAWIRVISGVDVESTIKTTSTIGDIKRYSSKQAETYVLSGGELVWDGKKFLRKSSFNTQRPADPEALNDRDRYRYSDAFGIRPEGGITGFTIRHKNRFGTVREANISFTVWSKEDFEVAENLYFRPGMTVITEWGNASYFSNDNNFKDVVTTNGVSEFFSGGQQVSQERVLKILNDNVKNSDYNYDAFFGFISNFSWSLREDGGFDCTITVVSRGSILDSLSVIKGNARLNGPFSKIEEKFFSIAKPPVTEEKEEEEEERGVIRRGLDRVGKYLDEFAEWVNDGLTYADTELEETQRLSLLHFFCLKVEEIDIEDLDEGYITFENFKSPTFNVVNGSSTGEEVTNYSTVSGRKEKTLEVNPVANLLKEELISQLGNTYTDLIAAGFNGKTSGEGRTAFRYISVRTFLALVNLAFLNGSDQNVPRFNLRNKKQYETFDNHFSFDPSSVILPKFPTQPELKASRRAIRLLSEIDDDDSLRQDVAARTLARQADKEPYTKVLLNNTSDNIAKSSISYLKTTSVLGDPNKTAENEHILNIYISTKLIKECLDIVFTKNTAEIDTLNVQTFVRTVLNEINNQLGGINELDIHYDEINDELSVVDRVKLIDDSLRREDIPVINLSGLPNTVKQVNMETKIASNLASMISISATSGTEGDPNNNPGLTEYNKGKRDRFKTNFEPVKTGSNDIDSDGPVSLEEQREQETAKKEEEASKREKREKFFLNLFQAYNKFNNKKFFDLRTKGVYNEKKFDKLKGEKISRTKEALAKDHKLKNEAPANIIPIELSLKLNGIAGLVVGQVFKIDSIFLPSLYADTGFIITSLDAAIEDSKWYTTVKAQTFMLNRRDKISTGTGNKQGTY